MLQNSLKHPENMCSSYIKQLGKKVRKKSSGKELETTLDKSSGKQVWKRSLETSSENNAAAMETKYKNRKQNGGNTSLP